MKKIIFISALAIGLFSCSNTKKAAAVNDADGTIVNNNNLPSADAMQKTGVDFFATGSQPVNWKLNMNFDDTVRFSTDDGFAVKFAYHMLKKETVGKKISYTGTVNGGNAVSMIQDEEKCTVPNFLKVFTHRVSFTYNGKTFTGCGNYTSDNSLNNKWMLEKIGNNNIAVEDYNRIPVLQFDLDKNKLSGNDGCNTIGGNIEVQGKRIKFSAIFSTRMACMKKSIDYLITNQLSEKTVGYYFRDGKLYLSLLDDSILVFKKA